MYSQQYQPPYSQPYQAKPLGVTLIAVLFFIAGVLGVLGGFLILAFPIPALDPATGMIASYQIVIGVVGVLIGGLEIAVGWGLLTLQNWARITAIVLLALAVLGNLLSGVTLLVGIDLQGFHITYPGAGIASLLAAIIEGVVIWYLAKFDIADRFGGAAMLPAMTAIPVSTSPVPPVPSPVGPTAPLGQQPPPYTAGPVPVREPTVPIGMPAQPVAWLVARSGSHAGKSFGLKPANNTMGRDPRRADIVLDDSTISGEHARVRYEGGQFYIHDLASTNGTFVNNFRVQRQMLMDNDIVRLGSVELTFKKA